MVILGKTLTKQHIPKIIGFSVIGVLVLGALVYGGLVWNEKRQFNQAEKEMDALAAQITEKIGKPDQQKKEKSCGYASREFGRGPRSCGYTIQLGYSGLDLEQANNRLMTISSLIGSKLYGPFGKSTQQTFSQTLVGDEELGQDLKFQINDQGHCGISYVYPLSESRANLQKFGKSADFKISLSCGAPAMLEYFPVAKN